MIKNINISELIRNAFLAREKSYSPYSEYMVGAALLTINEKIYHGCNIENSSYSVTNCAERTALFKAVSKGERSFLAIAIVGGKKDDKEICDYAYPCGVCRQALSEFVNPDEFYVIIAKSETDYIVNTLAELLPAGFSKNNLI